jgi:hypothetical protein
MAVKSRLSAWVDMCTTQARYVASQNPFNYSWHACYVLTLTVQTTVCVEAVFAMSQYRHTDIHFWCLTSSLYPNFHTMHGMTADVQGGVLFRVACLGSRVVFIQKESLVRLTKGCYKGDAAKEVAFAVQVTKTKELAIGSDVLEGCTPASML